MDLEFLNLFERGLGVVFLFFSNAKIETKDKGLFFSL
jgi:hypothetical protein